MNTPARWSVTELTDLDPHPVAQLPRVAMPAHTRTVGAKTPWDCPGHHTRDPNARAAAVTEYAVWLAGRLDLLHAARTELAGANLACSCPVDSGPCHRDVLLDIANPPADPFTAGGRAMGLTLRRPWASMLFVPEPLGGKLIDTRAWTTDYRGPVAVLAGSRLDERGMVAAESHGLDAAWHGAQTGWLGVVVLVDIHPAGRYCCSSGRWRQRPDIRLYHWVFSAPARLALRTYGRGFAGLRAVSWSVLVRRTAPTPTTASQLLTPEQEP
jgi:hypothetical protein